MSNKALDIEKINTKISKSSPSVIITTILEYFQDDEIAISFSGAEDVVLIDMCKKIGRPLQVFCLDTGRLHPETYRFIETVRDHYSIDIEMLFPNAQDVQNMVQKKGLFSFYKEGHQECCSIRKIAPLRKKITTLSAWITGQRQDQSPTRTSLAPLEVDKAFSTHSHQIVKINPLCFWSSKTIWNYILSSDVPYNPLHKKGFTSIGCEPCTRPILPSEHERSGRWWWETPGERECGLHTSSSK